ncbi:MAG: FAD-binding oxidoreductase [Chloroflexi bacterium]|nr:FAD-binding oxidoreductase [Chloroflexota bacterium]
MKSDVFIIGGGLVGLSCAYYLLKSGRQVTLLDPTHSPFGKGI